MLKLFHNPNQKYTPECPISVQQFCCSNETICNFAAAAPTSDVMDVNYASLIFIVDEDFLMSLVYLIFMDRIVLLINLFV